jgi:hypothetical protein
MTPVLSHDDEQVLRKAPSAVALGGAGGDLGLEVLVELPQALLASPAVRDVDVAAHVAPRPALLVEQDHRAPAEPAHLGGIRPHDPVLVVEWCARDDRALKRVDGLVPVVGVDRGGPGFAVDRVTNHQAEDRVVLGRADRLVPLQVIVEAADATRGLHEAETRLALAQGCLRPRPLHGRPAAIGHLADKRHLGVGPGPRVRLGHVEGRPEAALAQELRRNKGARPDLRHRGACGPLEALVERHVVHHHVGARALLGGVAAEVVGAQPSAVEVRHTPVAPQACDRAVLAVAVELDEGGLRRTEMPTEGFGRGAPHVARLVKPVQPLLKREAERLPTLGLNLAGRLGASAEHAGDGARLVADRRVGEGEPGLLVEAATVHHQREVRVVRCIPGQRRGEQGRDVGPDLAPHVAKASADRPRMLGAEDLGTALLCHLHGRR